MIRRVADAKVLTDGRAVREEATRHGLVDAGDLGRIHQVLRVVGPAFNYRNAHGGEESVAGDIESDCFAVCGCSRNGPEEDLIGPSAVIESKEGEAH